MKCQTCGEENSEDAEYCRKCGVALEKENGNYLLNFNSDEDESPVIEVNPPKTEPEIPNRPKVPIKPTQPLEPPTSHNHEPSFNENIEFEFNNNNAFQQEHLNAIPFIGYNIGDGIIDEIVPLGAYAFGYNSLEFDMHERFDLDVSLSKESLSQDKNVQGHLLLFPPVLSKLKYEDGEFLNVYLKPPEPMEDEPEVYLYNMANKNLPVNYGTLIWGQGPKKTETIPIQTDQTIEELYLGKPADLSKKIKMDWKQINSRFSEDPAIVHELNKNRDKFRWDVPIELLVEIENPVLTIIRSLETRINWDDFSANTSHYKDYLDLNDNEREQLLKELLDWYLWGDGKSFGALSSVIRNIQIAQVEVVIQNNTSFHVIQSQLNNIELSIEFPQMLKEMIMPGNITFLTKEPAGFVDLQENRVVFKKFSLEPWEERKIIIGLSWQILYKFNEMKFMVRGNYENAPSLLGTMVYTNPLGFPCVKINNHIEWNPGSVKRNGIYTDYEIDDSVFLKKKMDNSTFVQTINVDLEAIKLNLKNLKSIFDESLAEIKDIKDDLNTLYKTMPKKRTRNMEGNKNE